MLQNQADAHCFVLKTEEQAAQKIIKVKEIQAKNEAEAREVLRVPEKARIREIKTKAEKKRVRRE